MGFVSTSKKDGMEVEKKIFILSKFTHCGEETGGVAGRGRADLFGLEIYNNLYKITKI